MGSEGANGSSEGANRSSSLADNAAAGVSFIEASKWCCRQCGLQLLAMVQVHRQRYANTGFVAGFARGTSWTILLVIGIHPQGYSRALSARQRTRRSTVYRAPPGQ